LVINKKSINFDKERKKKTKKMVRKERQTNKTLGTGIHTVQVREGNTIRIEVFTDREWQEI
jgi:hypothetical protein